MSDDAPVEAIIEAILLVATEPVSVEVLSRVAGVKKVDIEDALVRLEQKYQDPKCGFGLGKVQDGFRYYSKSEFYSYVSAFSNETNDSKLSGAALETLAIIAYQQPISRSSVSIIRGVNSDQVMRLLAIKGYIIPVGRANGPGSSQLFATTPMFLERLGLNSLDDLPKLTDFAPSLEIAEALEISLRQDQN